MSISIVQKIAGAIVAVAAVIGMGIKTYEWLASKEYVKYEVTRVADPIQQDVKILVGMGLADQLDKLIRFKCRNPGNTDFDFLYREKIAAFKTATGKDYIEANCQQLGLVE